MWIRGQTRAIVNLDYVTSVEARVMEAYYTNDGQSRWEVIAYRRPPGQDAVLANMLPPKTAAAIVDRLGGAIMGEARLVDVMDLLDEVKYDQQKKEREQAALVPLAQDAFVPDPEAEPARPT